MILMKGYITYGRLLNLRLVPTSYIMIIIIVVKGVFVVVETPKNTIIEIFMIGTITVMIGHFLMLMIMFVSILML